MAYSDIKDPSAHFQIKLWTGNASSNEITFDGNSDLQADWIWHKEHNDSNGWHQTDTSIGIANYLASDDSAASYGVGSAYVSAIGSNSITYGSGDSSFNSNSVAQATWAWKANGGTTSSNTDGSITSTVQANQDAGFSIVTYTGNGTQTGQTVGHGLGAVPKMIISKERASLSNVPTWRVYHEAIGNTKYLTLNSTEAAGTYNDWDNTTPTSSVYSVGGAGGYTPTNSNTRTYVAYVFAEKQGYSKFGSYVGNGNANGTFVYTGFKPAFIMVKTTLVTDEWNIYDTKRSGFNFHNDAIYASSNVAEDAGSTYAFMDIVSNGFKLRRATHSPNKASTYIYMAFAENPFVAGGVPTTAR